MSELRKTPLHAVHLESGAKMVPFGGWDMPVEYSGLIAEHQAVRGAAGLFDVSHMGEFTIEGPGALAFLQRVTCNDAAKLVPGQAQYTALIAADLGDPVGYKAGLTNPAVQKRFGYDRPLRGTLYAKMILPGGAKVPAAYGSRPVYEADLVAVVGDVTKLMAAKAPQEALEGISAFRPFIELPDLSSTD